MRNNLTVFQSEKKNFIERNFGKEFQFQNFLRGVFLVFLIIGVFVYYYFDIEFNFNFNFLQIFTNSHLIILFFVFPFFISWHFLSNQKSKIVFTKNKIQIHFFYNEKKFSENSYTYESLEKIKFIKDKNIFGFRGVVLYRKDEKGKNTIFYFFALNTNEITNLQYFIEQTPELKKKIKLK